ARHGGRAHHGAATAGGLARHGCGARRRRPRAGHGRPGAQPRVPRPPARLGPVLARPRARVRAAERGHRARRRHPGHERVPGLARAEPVTGASTDSVAAWHATVGPLVVGGARFEHVDVTFADAPVLARIVPGGGPALVLGIDQLHTLRALAIDYPRAEVQLQ